MACLGLGAIEHFLIWLVIIFTIFAIIRVILGLASIPTEFAWLLSAVLQIIKIILWAVVIIALIVIVFSLLACVVPIRF